MEFMTARGEMAGSPAACNQQPAQQQPKATMKARPGRPGQWEKMDLIKREFLFG
jgi:hypothetical protein